jgi:hypothetical protein
MLTNQGIISFVVGGATPIPAGARVKFDAGTANAVVVAAHGDAEIGTAILYSGKDSYAVGDAVGVKLNNAPGSRHVIANSVFALQTGGAPTVLKRDDNGAVSDVAAGTAYAIALEAPSAVGDIVEALACPPFTLPAA